MQSILIIVPEILHKTNSKTILFTWTFAVTMSALLLSPLNAVAVTLIYFDTRVRKEGLDIVALAEESGVALAEVPR